MSNAITGFQFASTRKALTFTLISGNCPALSAQIIGLTTSELQTLTFDYVLEQKPVCDSSVP